MTRDELVELLGAHEWRDVEFKEARRTAPKDAYETVAAFANTEGGHLVFGVRGSDSDVEVVGVQDVDKVQGEFLNTVRQPRKFSVVVDVQEELHRLGGLDVLVFYIPEVSRSQKPVYLNDDIRRAFVRTGGSDVRCSASERNRFLVDAAPERYDGRSVEVDPAEAFDEESLRWYRAVYEAKPGNRSHAEASDLEFLAEMGLLVEQGERRLPTHAAAYARGRVALWCEQDAPAASAASGGGLPALLDEPRRRLHGRAVVRPLGAGRQLGAHVALVD